MAARCRVRIGMERREFAVFRAWFALFPVLRIVPEEQRKEQAITLIIAF